MRSRSARWCGPTSTSFCIVPGATVKWLVQKCQKRSNTGAGPWAAVVARAWTSFQGSRRE